MKSLVKHHLLVTQIKRVIAGRLTSITNRRRCSTSGSNEGDPSEKTLDGIYVPLRIRRRLKEKGLTVSDLKYNMKRDIPTETAQECLKSEDQEKEVEFPSDIENLNWYRNQERHAYRPPGVDPQNTSILLFPGQGSQFVGMGKKLLAYPGVEDIYMRASEMLQFDLLSMCLSGPQSELDKTKYCQPAVVVTSIAAVEKLKSEYPQALEQCIGMAGFSVGELTALIISGMVDFADAMQIIKLRAALMQHCSEKCPSGMLTVFCDHKTNLRTAMVAAREYCREKLRMEDPVCRIANYLCTDVKVVAGHEETIAFLEKYGREFGIKRTKRLPVSGAFHTELMHGGRQMVKFKDAWEKIELKEPKYKLYLNMDGKPLKYDEKFDNVRHIFRKHIMRPVYWEQTMHILYTRRQGLGFPKTYEVGPGNQLGILLKKTNAKAYDHYVNIEC